VAARESDARLIAECFRFFTLIPVPRPTGAMRAISPPSTPCPQAPCFTPPSVGFLFPFALAFAACGGVDAVGRLAL